MGYVSNPSYFPAAHGNDAITGNNAGIGATGSRLFLAGQSAGNNSSVSDLVIIGHLSGSAGITDGNAEYTTIVGSNSLDAATDFSTQYQGSSTAGPIVSLGGNNAPLSVHGFGGSVLVGSNIATNFTGTVHSSNQGGSVLIGDSVAGNLASVQTTFGANVMIGYACYASNGAAAQDAGGNVFIGAFAVANGGPNGVGTCGQHVVIGYQAGLVLGESSGNVLIGSQNSTQLTTGGNNVVIGQEAVVQLAGSNNVVVGGNSNVANGSNNTAVGANIEFLEGGAGGVTNIAIGCGAGNGASNASNYQLFVETYDGATQRGMLWGDMTKGSILVGNSAAGANREFGGVGATNVLKMLNGTKGGTAPVGGGYFYCTAGALHWVGTSGTDTQLAVA